MDDDHLCLIIADVSGKGVPASLYMMISKVILEIYTDLGNSPAEIMESVNKRLIKNNTSDMFVTVWLGIVRKAIDGFAGDEEQFDDLTMLCLEYKGK